MPHARARDGTRLFFETFGDPNAACRVVLIIGVAGRYLDWQPQLPRGAAALLGHRWQTGSQAEELAQASSDLPTLYRQALSDVSPVLRAAPAELFEAAGGICFLTMDNRGSGGSDAPAHREAYSTFLMAQDVLAVMDAVGWRSAHLIGHSLGGMIACKTAAIAPARVRSLAVIASSGGGFQALPPLAGAGALLQVALARTPADRAFADLQCHFTPAYLNERATPDGRRRADWLWAEYLRNGELQKAAAAGAERNGRRWGPHDAVQSVAGQEGQLYAVWHHSLTDGELGAIHAAGLPVLVIHGRGDAIADWHGARALAGRLRAGFLLIEQGNHMVQRERAAEVNPRLAALLAAAERRWQQQERRSPERATAIERWGGGGALTVASAPPPRPLVQTAAALGLPAQTPPRPLPGQAAVGVPAVFGAVPGYALMDPRMGPGRDGGRRGRGGDGCVIA